ncbi:hypothetical protein TWF481_009258 [Arthrobotrys musiformis]|uniref:Uncharacterized protein n=1 Tax=Arthrobotrys musiformis TaxID=47236 RepID=A0AAV9W385_9PEZI
MQGQTIPENWRAEGSRTVTLATSENFANWFDEVSRSSYIPIANRSRECIPEETKEEEEARIAREWESYKFIMNADFNVIGARVRMKRGGEITPPRPSSVEVGPGSVEAEKYLADERERLLPTLSLLDSRPRRSVITPLPGPSIRVKVVEARMVRNDTVTAELPDTSLADMWIPLEHFPHAEDERFRLPGFVYPAYIHPVNIEITGIPQTFRSHAIFTNSANFPEGIPTSVPGHLSSFDRLKVLWTGCQTGQDDANEMNLCQFNRVGSEVADSYKSS